MFPALTRVKEQEKNNQQSKQMQIKNNKHRQKNIKMRLYQYDRTYSNNEQNHQNKSSLYHVIRKLKAHCSKKEYKN